MLRAWVRRYKGLKIRRGYPTDNTAEIRFGHRIDWPSVISTTIRQKTHYCGVPKDRTILPPLGNLAFIEIKLCHHTYVASYRDVQLSNLLA